MPKSSRNITDFFQPFTIPKNRIPRQDEDEEIVVASSTQHAGDTLSSTASCQPSLSPPKSQHNAVNPAKRGRGRPRKSHAVSPSKPRLKTSNLEQSRSGGSTPTRRSPRKNMSRSEAVEDAPPISSGLTTLPSSSQRSPIKSRVLEAVDIPSPVKDPAQMPALSQLPKQEPRNATNTSFSSFSTLTSVSGVSSQSSSRRIVKKGMQAVTNSDSASMSSSSSEDELADFESFAPRKKRKLTPPGLDKAEGLGKPGTAKSTRSSTRLDQQNARARTNDSWRPLSPPPTTSYKHSLLNIAKQHAREVASEEKIAEAEAYVKETERLRTLQNERVLEESESRQMAAALAQDSDDEERMLMAMDRTEALREKEIFYFFRGQLEDRIDLEFPAEALDSFGLTCLKDAANRDRACASGFLATVASQKGLPGSVITWISHQILQENSEELCESYVGILDALVKSGHNVPEPAFSLSEIYVGQTFRDAEDTMEGQDNAALPHNIRHVLEGMAALAPRVSSVRKACALAELILLNIDDNVSGDIGLQLHIEQAMHAILGSDDEGSLQTIFQETTRQIMHASSISRQILARAVASLPATTIRLHNLRRGLSLHILLGAPLDEVLDICSPSTGIRLLRKLQKHPSFHISESTNYVALHSLIDLIDIAIDAGFSDAVFLTQPHETEVKAQPKSLFNTAQAPAKREEASFNEQIDALTAQLRLMGSKIRDAGTSHLKRTEAKSALERLVVRLECAVRTRPRPRKGVFERGGLGNVGSAAMDAFLNRSMSGRNAERSQVGNGDDDGSADTEQESNGPRVAGFQRGPGKQHKVTWKDELVQDTEAGAEADEKSTHA